MKSIPQFFREVRLELSRVEWPKREDFIGATIVTLVLVLFFTIFLGAMDRASRWIIYDKIFSQIRR